MLTAKAIENAAPNHKVYRLFEAHSLYLEVTPNGGKYWRLKYHIMGKEKRISIGIYPAVSLLEARHKREQLRLMIQDNIDPAAVKKRDEKD
jgi:hypothetical protein